MAEVRKRQHVQIEGKTSDKSSVSKNDSKGMTSGRSAVFLKLFAAGFYGLSSFLIVVVNKSVLTSYRYAYSSLCMGSWLDFGH